MFNEMAGENNADSNCNNEQMPLTYKHRKEFTVKCWKSTIMEEEKKYLTIGVGQSEKKKKKKIVVALKWTTSAH